MDCFIATASDTAFAIDDSCLRFQMLSEEAVARARLIEYAVEPSEAVAEEDEVAETILIGLVKSAKVFILGKFTLKEYEPLPEIVEDLSILVAVDPALADEV